MVFSLKLDNTFLYNYFQLIDLGIDHQRYLNFCVVIKKCMLFCIQFIVYWFFIILNDKTMNTRFFIYLCDRCKFFDFILSQDSHWITSHTCRRNVETTSPICLQILPQPFVDTTRHFCVDWSGIVDQSTDTTVAT